MATCAIESTGVKRELYSSSKFVNARTGNFKLITVYKRHRYNELNVCKRCGAEKEPS